MNLRNTGIKACIVLLLGMSLISCEEDFNTIGTDIVGDTNFNAALFEGTKIKAYTQPYQAVQSNGLYAYVLGIYQDDLYGQSTASILSQVSLSRYNPNFGENVVLDSVVFSMPYRSSIESAATAETGAVYELEDVLGSAPIRLTAFRSNYFLNSQDPASEFEEPQTYFSNQVSTFSGVEGDVLFDLTEFTPSAEEVVLVTPAEEEGNDDVVTREAPALRVKLDTTYWKNTIISRAGDEVLLNANNFKNYFRGIYLKAESITEAGTIMILDLDQANITLHYTFDGASDDSGDDNVDLDRTTGTLILNLVSPTQESNIQVNEFSNNFNPDVMAAFENANAETGDERLYVKGMDGSTALIDLFGDEEQLDSLRNLGWLINEANLTFYVDQEALAAASVPAEREPERVYLFNAETSFPLVDYLADQTRGSLQNPVRTHLGPLEREEDESGILYKIRVTRLVDSILNFDVDPVRLGLVVSENVLELDTAEVLLEDGEAPPEQIPESTIVQPLGTLLHGNRSSNQEKRLKLRIYYTESEN
ncbi:DUF4270 domain-containing protein [Croceiramulus getboli]|nr:DUF4270 domain-containing protein [Flavobacteriaceae bacterium YJPT1-3]